jgi:hypothetical protein
MKPTIHTQPRIGDLPKRRKKKTPSPETVLRIEWLAWLIEEFGAETASEWQEPPVTFREWCRTRSLNAHEAA